MNLITSRDLVGCWHKLSFPINTTVDVLPKCTTEVTSGKTIMLKQEQFKYKLHRSMCSAPEDRSLYIHGLFVENTDPQSVFSSLSVCVCMCVCPCALTHAVVVSHVVNVAGWGQVSTTQQVSSLQSQKGRRYFSYHSGQTKKNTPDWFHWRVIKEYIQYQTGIRSYI